MLRKLALRDRGDGQILAEQQGARGGRALVDGEKIHAQTLSGTDTF